MAADTGGEGAAEGYLKDVAYLRTFTGELAPSLLRLVAALNGFPAPPADDFDYGELGSGNGDTLTALAAAYPRARFLGVDFNPEHVAFATGLAARGGLGNVRFLERDFEDLGRDEPRSFDFLAAHGVLSWVAPGKRRAVIALAGARLKPGGLFFASYNALPGWAAVEPLRRLLLDYSAGVPGDAVERARHGVGLANLLAAGGAGYFAHNPAAREMLATMQKAGLPYVAHEYLQPDWHPSYFADVAREMAASDLYYVGQLPLHLNYRDLTIPPALAAQFRTLDDRLAFESLKDYALNEFFRRDVYVKGRVARSDEAARAYFEATPFGALAGAGQLRREAVLPHYTLDFVGPIFDALLPALGAAAAAIPELARRPELAPFGAARVGDAVRHLLLGGQVVPMQRSTEAAPAPGAGTFRLPLAYNRMVLAQPLSPASPIVLASEAAGTGLPVPMLEAVALRLLTEVAPAERPAWIRAFVGRQPLTLAVEGRPVEGAGAQARLLAAQLERFCAERLPKLVELGVVEAAG